MVDVYRNSSRRFNADQQPHYIYSPRELSRRTRAMYRALEHLEDVGGFEAGECLGDWKHFNSALEGPGAFGKICFWSNTRELLEDVGGELGG